MKRLASIVVVLLALAACKKQESSPRPLAPLPGDGAGTGAAPPDPTPPPSAMNDAEFDALMMDVVAYITKVGAAVTAANGDCAKMATGIEAVAADHREVIARARALDEDPSAEDRGDAWMKAHEADIAPVFQALFEGLAPCQSDPAVRAAIEKMGT